MKLNDYLKKINDIKSKAQDDSVEFYFRADKDNPMPSIQNYLKDEHEIINEVLSAHPDAFKNMSKFDKLTMMRHYECPSRLLDITSNPLVALYFACGLNENKTNKNIYIYAINKTDIKTSNSDTVTILSNLATISPYRLLQDKAKIANQKNFEKKINDNKSNVEELSKISEKLDEKLDEEPNTKGNILFLMREIHQENPSFLDLINYNDLDGRIVCVKPSYYTNNPRMLAQQGAFLLFGANKMNKLDMPVLEIKKDRNGIQILDKVKVAASDMIKLAEELSNVGISQRTMFPELPTTIEHIKRSYSINKFFDRISKKNIEDAMILRDKKDIRKLRNEDEKKQIIASAYGLANSIDVDSLTSDMIDDAMNHIKKLMEED